MKGITRWDSTGLYVSSDAVPDDYQLKANETFDELPKDGFQPYHRIGGADGHWEGSTLEQFNAWRKQQADAYLAQHPELKQQQQPSEPSAQDKLNAQLTLDIAQLKKQLQGTTAQANA